MRNILILLGVLLLPARLATEPVATESPAANESYKADTFSYPELTIPQFFKSLTGNHKSDFAMPDSGNYKSVCAQFDLNPADSGNFSKYYTLDILHRLFTANTCSSPTFSRPIQSTGLRCVIPFQPSAGAVSGRWLLSV